MSTVILAGRLTADPETRTTATGEHTVCKFRLAVDQPNKPAMFINVDTWDALAELCGRHLSKGRQVTISGRLAANEWEDRDGHRRTTYSVTATEVTFLDPTTKAG